MSDNLAVIFDMDGVLVDSYHAHFKSWQAVAAEEGLAISEADFASQFGRTSREIIAAYWGHGSYTDRPPIGGAFLCPTEWAAELDDRKEACFRRILEADFPVMPGAPDLLRSLDEAGFALAVGSSGPPANIELVLSRLGNRSLFRAMVTGMDVTRGKPDPQVFLIAAKRLDVPPRRCAVVEDAPPGVQAANAAGMASVGLISTGRTRESLAQADLVVGSLAELSPRILRDLVNP